MKRYCVDIFEYDRGKGSKLDETKEFASKGEALGFAKKFNSKNNKTVVPDWYLIASLPYPKK